MTRSVSGNDAPDFGSQDWSHLNDGAAASKPQLVDTSQIQRGQDSVEDAREKQEQISPLGAQSGLPAAPLGDPLNKSALLALMAVKAQLPPQNAIDHSLDEARRGVLYDSAGASSSGTATKAAPTLPADVSTVLEKPPKNSVAADAMKAAEKYIKAGDFTKAYECLNNVIEKKGEFLDSNSEIPQLSTIRDQLGFLSGMQKAGIKVSYPPTEAQLVDYFKTLKDNPAGAREAFQNYAKDFNVHPANVYTDDYDIKYSHTTTKYNGVSYPTDAPQKWDDVVGRSPLSDKFPQFVGKQMNDCQGYGFIAAELLGAAGFKVSNYVTAYPSLHGNSHDMVMFTHPGEKGVTLTSNDGVFTGGNAKAVAKQGYEYAAGKQKVTGKEEFYIGPTMADAEVQAGVKDNKL